MTDATTTEAAPVVAKPIDTLRTRLLALLSRKWLLCVYIALAATVLRCFNLLDQTGLLTVWGSVLSIFSFANVAQKATSK